MTSGGCWNEPSSTHCFLSDEMTSFDRMNECTLNVKVGPCGIRETFIDIDFSERVNKHIWDTWKIPERLTKSLILFDFRSFNWEAVNGSIIFLKSRDKVTMNGPEKRN